MSSGTYKPKLLVVIAKVTGLRTLLSRFVLKIYAWLVAVASKSRYSFPILIIITRSLMLIWMSWFHMFANARKSSLSSCGERLITLWPRGLVDFQNYCELVRFILERCCSECTNHMEIGFMCMLFDYHYKFMYIYNCVCVNNICHNPSY